VNQHEPNAVGWDASVERDHRVPRAKGSMQCRTGWKDEDADSGHDYASVNEMTARRALLHRRWIVAETSAARHPEPSALADETVTLEDLTREYDVTVHASRQIECGAFEKLQKRMRELPVPRYAGKAPDHSGLKQA